MLTVTAGSASELFAGACRAVLASGKPAAPRGLPTVEVLGATLVLTDPRRRLVDVPPGPADQPGVRRRRDGVDLVRAPTLPGSTTTTSASPSTRTTGG